MWVYVCDSMVGSGGSDVVVRIRYAAGMREIEGNRVLLRRLGRLLSSGRSDCVYYEQGVGCGVGEYGQLIL